MPHLGACEYPFQGEPVRANPGMDIHMLLGEAWNVIPSKSHLDHGKDIPKSPNYEKDIPWLMYIPWNGYSMADVLTMKRIFHGLYMSHGISFSWLGDYGISIPYARQLLGIHNFPISLRGNNNQNFSNWIIFPKITI